jgi:hypothetical protein
MLINAKMKKDGDYGARSAALIGWKSQPGCLVAAEVVGDARSREVFMQR